MLLQKFTTTNRYDTHKNNSLYKFIQSPYNRIVDLWLLKVWIMNSEADSGNATESKMNTPLLSFSRGSRIGAVVIEMACVPLSAAIYRVKPVSGIKSDLSKIFLSALSARVGPQI